MYYYPFSCLLRNKDTSGISVRNVLNQGKHQNFFSSIFRCDNLDTLNSKINPLLAILFSLEKGDKLTHTPNLHILVMVTSIGVFKTLVVTREFGKSWQKK